MIMFEQSRRLSEPLRWGRREKTIAAVLISCVVLALAGLGAYALTTGAPARKDCIQLTFASTLGAGFVHEGCAQARRLCATPNPSREIGQELDEECRRLGFPLGSR